MLTNERKEKISAFLDNDMHHDELMSFSLSAEPDDAETARRYQMVGDSLRGEMSDSSFIDVSHAVREAVAGEQTYTATDVRQSVSRDATGNVRSGIFNLSAWFRPVAGMAVAASVAVIMIITVSDKDANGPAMLADAVEEQPAVQLAIEDASTGKVIDQDAREVRYLDQRLVNQHLEYATQDALQGRLPLVRAVSFEAEK